MKKPTDEAKNEPRITEEELTRELIPIVATRRVLYAFPKKGKAYLIRRSLLFAKKYFVFFREEMLNSILETNGQQAVITVRLSL